MKQQVLLIYILIVQCGGCNVSLKAGVENLKGTIDSNHAGFREVFPTDYQTAHHYDDRLLCPELCCVSRSAAVLSDSWEQLLKRLWPENYKFKLIQEVIEALDKIAEKKFQEEPDVSILPLRSSSPEDLRNYTSVLFSMYLQMELHCSSSESLCSFPTETPPQAEEPQKTPWKQKVLTTRDVRQEMEGQREHMFDDSSPPTNEGQTSAQFPDSRTLLLWGLVYCANVLLLG
ncbi:uncharacterized protein zgc:174888 [Hypomesus transpacificus]|uniref:uncharacterized protein zgc:174888 n=1 Tax=Hypomesus transpacificus TaxID=137520 RepID=UPI001F07B3EA|nr:uncharacterized protein zgc:174888 [Hypomesus transpacificus]